MIAPVGLDLGNTWTNICVQGKVAKIPSRYAFDRPPGAISTKTGQELKPVAFSLLFEDQELWFGQDTLAIGGIQKLEMQKYNADHISILFRAALYQWGKQHKVDLATLGKLNVVASMPPGLFKDTAKNKRALTAYRTAFNRGQRHAKIRDGKKAVQIVTQFGGLVREAVAWGSDIPRKNELILAVDIGGGTVDYVLFNGSSEPLATWTDNAGLLYAYSKINSLDPGKAELKLLRAGNASRRLPHQLVTCYNEVERRIQNINLRLPNPVVRIYIIGGGAALMPPKIRATFTPLASKVIIKNEYVNSIANWHEAGGE